MSNRKQEKLAAEIAQTKGLRDAVPVSKGPEQVYEIERLKRENQLLLDFFYFAGRR